MRMLRVPARSAKRRANPSVLGRRRRSETGAESKIGIAQYDPKSAEFLAGRLHEVHQSRAAPIFCIMLRCRRVAALNVRAAARLNLI